MVAPTFYSEMSDEQEVFRTGASPAAAVIATGTVAAGEVLGVRARGERPWAEQEAEPLPAAPDLRLLLFTDEDELDRHSTSYGSWESTQPPSYAEWAYRCSPWRKFKATAERKAVAEHKIPSRRISCASGPCTDLSTIAEAAQEEDSPMECKRSANDTPSSMAGSTRVPSRATPAASPEVVHRFAMPRPPARQPPRTGPRRPQSSLGISRGSRAEYLPTDSVPDRPQSSLGIFRAAAVETPPPGLFNRPGTSMGFSYGSDSHKTLGNQLLADTTSRSSSPDGHDTLSTEMENVEVSPALSRVAQLEVAAQEAGARARGEVTLAIRSRAVCRLAASSASRRLLHLSGERTYPPRPGSKAESHKEASQEFEWSVTHTHTDTRIPMTPLGTILAIEPVAARKRVIKVAANTALGRMVNEDPERAAKYDLVTVPAWQQNKSWPPPSPKSQRLLERGIENRRAREASEAAEQALRAERVQVRKRKTRTVTSKMHAVSNVLSLQKNSSAQLSIPSECVHHDTITEDNLDIENTNNIADFDTASTRLDWSEKEVFRAIFNRHSKHDDYKLSRNGIIKAMYEVNLTPNSAEEQRLFAAVQEQVLRHTRGVLDEEIEKNPLRSRFGWWELDEFVLLCATLRELSLRQLRLSNKELAEEFNLPVQEVEELRTMFNLHSPDRSNTIPMRELREILAAIELKTTEDDFSHLLSRAGLNKVERLEFKEFLKLITALEKFMKHPIQAVLHREVEQRQKYVVFGDSSSEKRPAFLRLKRGKTFNSLVQSHSTSAAEGPITST